MIKIKINFVDESYREWEEKESIMYEFFRLVEVGYKGKSLIDTLISDDWSAPPLFVSFNGELSDGTQIKESIRYSRGF